MQGNCQSCTAHARSLIPSLSVSVTPVRFCDCFLNWRAASAAGAITSNLSWQQCVPSRPAHRDPVNLSIATRRHLTGPCHSPSHCFLSCRHCVACKTCRLLSLFIYLFVIFCLAPLFLSFFSFVLLLFLFSVFSFLFLPSA